MAGEVNVNSFNNRELKAFAQAADQNGDFKLDSVEKRLFENLVGQAGLAMEDEFSSVMGEAAANVPDAKTNQKQMKAAEKADEQRYKTAFGRSYNKETMASVRSLEAEANTRVGNAFQRMKGYVDPNKLTAHIAKRPDVAQFSSVEDYTAALTRWADGMEALDTQTTNEMVASGFDDINARLDEQTGIILDGIIAVGQEVVDILEEDLGRVAQYLDQQIQSGTATVIKQVRSSAGAIIQQIRTSEGNIIEVTRQEGRMTRATVVSYGQANLNATSFWGNLNFSATRKYGEANLAETRRQGRMTRNHVTQTAAETEAVNGEVARITSGLDNHTHIGPTRNRVQTVMAKITNSTLPSATKVELLHRLGNLANDVNIYPDEINTIEQRVDEAIESADAHQVADVETTGSAPHIRPSGVLRTLRNMAN